MIASVGKRGLVVPCNAQRDAGGEHRRFGTGAGHRRFGLARDTETERSAS